MKTSLLRITLWIIAILAVVIFLLAYWHHATLYPSTDDAYVQAHVIHVTPQVSGPIRKIYIQNNQLVKKNDPLFDIDPALFEVAAYAAAAKLELANQAVASLQDAVKTATALVAQRESELDVTQKNASRVFELVAKHQESLQKQDEMNNQVRVAIAALTAAKSQLAEAKEKLGNIGPQNAQVRAAQAALDQAKLNLAYTHVVAPAAGKIVNFTLRVGNYASAGVPLFDLVDPSQWWVSANFKETQLARIHPNQSAKIVLDIYPSYTFNGIVESISAGSGSAFSLLPPENATGNWVKVTQRIPVKVDILKTDPKFPLRVGASATVTIDTRTTHGK